jgi:hypothetical protein
MASRSASTIAVIAWLRPNKAAGRRNESASTLDQIRLRDSAVLAPVAPGSA